MKLSPPTLARAYERVRADSLALAEPLSAEDCQVQSMPDASPVKWHLAHVTWFFETFVLERHERGFRPFDERFRVLFNSYYQGIGEQYPRPQRGLIASPTLETVKRYRAQVDARLAELLVRRGDEPALAALIALGLQHEQQHQELIVTDMLHALAANPGHAPFARRWPHVPAPARALHWLGFDGGMVESGHDAARDGAFCFDNETPRHRAFLAPFEMPRGRSARANSAPSSMTAATRARNCGSRSAGTGCAPAGALRRCTGSGSMATGGATRCTATSNSTRTPRPAT